MSAIVKLVSNVVGAVVSVAWDIVKTVWDEVLMPVLEVIAGIFGIKDEDIISTEVITTRLFEDSDDIVKQTLTKISLERQKNPEAPMSAILTKYSNTARGKLAPYFYNGKHRFIDGLPDTNLHSYYVDKVAVTDVISEEIDSSITLVTVKANTPNKHEYYEWLYQSKYSYKPGTGRLTYTDSDDNTYNDYQMDYINYDYDTNSYDITISRHEDVTTYYITRTTITITNIDEDNDNKNTVIEDVVRVVGTISGVISETSEEVSNTDETIPADSETDSATEVVNDSSTDTNVTVDSTIVVLNEDAYVPEIYVIAEYYTTDMNDWYYWLYDTTLGTYPEIEPKNAYITNLEMLPIVVIRNGTVNIDNDTSSEAYKSTKEIIKTLGLDVDDLLSAVKDNPDIDSIEDAFVMFAVNPTDNIPSISKALYEMFSYTFDDDSIQDNNEDKYIATFSEGPVNLALTWDTQTRTTAQEYIGPINTYTHEIVGSSLVMKKQVTAGYVTTIMLTTLGSVTYVDREGLVGLVALNLGDANFTIPLSFYIVNKLSPFEQLEIFYYALRLNFYAAQVTHLEWYQTASFFNLIRVLAIVVVVVISVATAGVGASLSTVLLTILENMAIGFALSLVLNKLLEMTDNPWLKALIAVAAVIASVESGVLDVELFSPETALLLVSNFADIVAGDYAMKTEKLGKEMQRLEDKYEAFKDKVEGYYEGLSDISAEYVAYLKSPDTMMYIAKGGPMYDYGNYYSYDKAVADFHKDKLKLGVL